MQVLAILVLAVLALVPGLAAVRAVEPREPLAPPLRAALVFALGYAVVGGVAFLLALVHQMRAAVYVPVLVAVTIALWAFALRRRDRPGLAAGIEGDRGAILLGVVVILAIAAFRATVPTVLAVRNSATWRYWSDGLEIADSHRVPAHSLQYGSVEPPVESKVFANAFAGAVSLPLRSRPFHALGAMLWFGSAGLAVSLWALGWAFGLRWTAALLPLLTVANRVVLDTEIARDLTVYNTETIGRMVAFAAVALAVTAIARRDRWRLAALAGGLLAVAAATHLIPALIGGLLLGGWVLAGLVAERRLAIVRPAAVVAGSALVLAAALLLLPRADLGLTGASREGSYAEFGQGFDPTLYLSLGVPPGRVHVTKGRWRLSVSRVVSTYERSSVGIGSHTKVPRWVGLLVIPLLELAVAIAVLLLGPRELRAGPLAAWLLAAAIMAVTWSFAARSTYYVQSTFGARRLFDYSGLVIVLIVLPAIEIALAALAGRSARSGLALAVALTALASAVLLPTSHTDPSSEADAVHQLAVVNWIRATLPCDVRILPSVRSAGGFEALTGRVSVVEGSTPYLRPTIMVPVLRQLLAARAFFEDPTGHGAFLREQAVDVVLLLGRPMLGYPKPLGIPDVAALLDDPDLERIPSAPDGVLAFRVRDPAPATDFPSAPGFPGYRCGTAPLGG